MMTKFRLYDLESCEMWVADDYEDLSEMFMALDADNSMFSEPMRFTGLKDKNGNDIFEGDIVVDDYGVINTIVFTEYITTDYYGETHLGFISENDEYIDQHITLPNLIKIGIQVIGNIYETESVEE